MLVAGVRLSGPFPQVRTALTGPHRRTDGMTTHGRSGLVSASTADAVSVKLCSEFHDLDITFSVVRNYSTGTRWLPAMMSTQQKKILRVMNWVHIAAVPRGEPQAVQGPGVAAHHHVKRPLLYCTHHNVQCGFEPGLPTKVTLVTLLRNIASSPLPLQKVAYRHHNAELALPPEAA